MVQEEVGQLRARPTAWNLTLDYDYVKNFPELKLDETKTRQVIMKFINNALYYTPSGGKVTNRLKETEKSVEFIATDTGMGVPKTELPKLFIKFYRADNAKRTRPDGTGLGLFMAKKVVVPHGGAVIFHS